MLTLNQTIEILKNFSLKHKQLGKGTSSAHFYFGDKWEVNDNDDLLYPLMWVSLLPTQTDKSGLVTRKFQIDISDKVNLDESNETHVLSDTESICFDLLNYLEQVADGQEIGMLFGNTSELTDYTEDRDDTVSGWFFTVEIKAHQQSTSCYLPIVNGNILDDNYIYVGGTYTPITNTMSILTEEFIYGTDPVVLSNTPTNILTVFAGASVLFNTDDYTRSGATFTITNPLVENGDKIRITYTY